MLNSPLVSIIIPCRSIDDYTIECIKHCKKLWYQDFEIILLPDYDEGEIEGVKVVPTGPLTPGVKRNIGVQNSAGEICAFIDSDAYPRRNWLQNAIKYLGDPQIGAVGGPGITPHDADLMRRAGGYVLSSFMVGNLSSRYKSVVDFDSCDIHSCNFIVKRAILEKIGGWEEKYWPGEDTLICLAIRKLGQRLVEASDVVVYHHRRPLYLQHLKQISRFGLHRGFFAKRFRGNSFKLTYFAPAFLVLFLLSGSLFSLVNPTFLSFFLWLIVLYLGLSFTSVLLQVRDVKLILLACIGIPVTHLVYGLAFLRGLMKLDLRK